LNLILKTTQLFCLTFILQSVLSLAQEFPDYSERALQEQLDSLRSTGEIFQTEATEGSINPEEYYVGPGDILFISISGVKELIHKLSINQEGWLYIPQVGGVDLINSTLKNSKLKIEQTINRYYKDVKIFISLTNFRKIRVSLIGDVKRPANLVVSANSRLMDIISMSEGLNETANFRNIKINSKDGSSKEVDLLAFLRLGEYENNPYLREGDIVLVDRVDKTIKISGQIKYPGVYEFVDNEPVKRFIQMSGGLLSKAYKDTIELVSFLSDGSVQESKYYNFDSLMNNDYLMRSQDHIIIRKVPEFYIEHFVLVNGFVKFPGFYKIIKDKTKLTDVINLAGGFLEEASLTEATLSRRINKDDEDSEFERLKLIPTSDMTEDEYDYFKARSRERSGRVVIDFNALFNEQSYQEDLILKRGDIIRIPEKKNYITMLGQLVKPGNIVYDSSLTVENYILLAGGFGWRALEGEVRVIKANSGEWVYADEVGHLHPGDAIWVPEDPPDATFWEIFTSTLQVLGQVAAVIAAAAAIIIATR
jgi:protein involved in polysaccharide export with SLBB domain